MAGEGVLTNPWAIGRLWWKGRFKVYTSLRASPKVMCVVRVKQKAIVDWLVHNNEQPYPTKPIEIVAEVLSPKDRPGHVLDKCRHYQNIGISQI
jgi:Uma2 family endonuclease